MAERFDEWPRVHTCLRSWCPSKREECERCDAVCRLLIEAERGKRDLSPRLSSEQLGGER